MTNTDLGACEVFISELRRSGLVERGQLDQLLEEFIRRNPHADPTSLAEHLVARGTLTVFQAERVLTGKTQGLVLGAYVLTDSVGAGSMGSVYKAVSKNDHKVYAVKVLPRRSMWNVRLARRQVRAFGQFQHASVVPFVDVGTAGGLHYLVWNFIEGETLEAMVQRLGKIDPATAAQIGLQVAAGLVAAHGHGLFHGLLKPSNIMISTGGHVRILDFGIGSLLAENEGESLVDTMSTSNTLTSGLDCASPESIMEPTNRTPAGDQYSLGCVMYYCLAGRYPFADGSAVEKMMAHQFKQPTPVTELVSETPPELAVVIERLMQKKPEDRFRGVDGAVEALTPLAPKSLPEPATQALTQTPTQPLTHSSLKPMRQSNHPAAPVPADEPPAPINEYLPPSRQAGPLPGSHNAPPAILPTRRSLHGDPQPTAEVSVQHPKSSIYAGSNPLPAEEPPAPVLGPVGFVVLGATVALACYILVSNLLH